MVGRPSTFLTETASPVQTGSSSPQKCWDKDTILVDLVWSWGLDCMQPEGRGQNPANAGIDTPERDSGCPGHRVPGTGRPCATCLTVLPAMPTYFRDNAPGMRLWMETPFVTAVASSACHCPALPASH